MFSVGFITLDILIILAVVIGFFFIGMSKGEHILARIILSFYPATLIYLFLPYINVSGAIAHIATYIAIYFVVHLLLAKNFTAKRAFGGGKKVFDSIVLAITATIVLLTIYYHVLPVADIYQFTLPFSSLFTATLPFGMWMIIPILGLVLSNKGHH